MKTDEEGWDSSKRDQFALLAMVGLGVGEIVGAMGFGKVQDNTSIKVQIAINMLSAVVGFGILMGFTIRYEFNLVFGFAMTFFWGISDGMLNTLINCVLGFQFDSKTTPFSVNKFLQSLLIFLIICAESFIETKDEYLFYFIFELAFCILSWLLVNFFFTFRNPEDTEKGFERLPSTNETKS